MVKKSVLDFFTQGTGKARFPDSFIFNGLQPSKMTTRPCVAHRVVKKGFFTTLFGQVGKFPPIANPHISPRG
jgi:hypothetical protein